MFGSRRSELEAALEEALEELEETRRALAESRYKAALAKERIQTLEREQTALKGVLEAAKRHIRKLEASLAEASANRSDVILDQVAAALARRPKPSFAEDESGPLASFKVDGELVVLRPKLGESQRAFKTRVWQKWLALTLKSKIR